MEASIHVVDWKVVEKNKQKTIGGHYEIRFGGTVASKSEFNDGYNATEIQIPSSIMLEIEAIDAKLRQAVVDNFTK